MFDLGSTAKSSDVIHEQFLSNGSHFLSQGYVLVNFRNMLYKVNFDQCSSIFSSVGRTLKRFFSGISISLYEAVYITFGAF